MLAATDMRQRSGQGGGALWLELGSDSPDNTANLKLWILPLPPECQGYSAIVLSIWRLAEVTETSYSLIGI